MASCDALWLHMEKPTCSMANHVILWFEEPLAWEALCEVIHQRLVRRFPRFRQRAEPRGWGFQWEEALEFQLEEHLRRTVLPSPAGRAELEALASQILSNPLERTRPLWDMRLVEEYGQGSALLMRVHHSMSDGMTLMRLILSSMDTSPAGGAPALAPVHEQQELREDLARTRSGFRAQWVATAGRLLTTRSDHPSLIRGSLGVEKRVVWSDPLPLALWRRMGHDTGATLNDVFLSVVAGALGRYLREHSARAEELRANVAVQLHSPNAVLSLERGNDLGIWLLELPVEERDPLVRLRKVCRRTSTRKHSLEAAVYRDVMSWIGNARMATRAGTRLLGGRCSLAVSNMRGPREPVFLAGRRVAGVTFWMPMVLDVGLGVTFCSQAGEATLGVSVDTGLIPQPREFLLALYQEVRELAGRDTAVLPLEWRL